MNPLTIIAVACCSESPRLQVEELVVTHLRDGGLVPMRASFSSLRPRVGAALVVEDERAHRTWLFLVGALSTFTRPR
jgi:hypothetical protein